MALYTQGSIFQQSYIPEDPYSQGSIFLHLYVHIVPCCQGLVNPSIYVPIPHVPIFSLLHILRVLISQSYIFMWPYIPSTLCPQSYVTRPVKAHSSIFHGS